MKSHFLTSSFCPFHSSLSGLPWRVLTGTSRISLLSPEGQSIIPRGQFKVEVALLILVLLFCRLTFTFLIINICLRIPSSQFTLRKKEQGCWYRRLSCVP